MQELGQESDVWGTARSVGLWHLKLTSSSLTHCKERWLQWTHIAFLRMLMRSSSCCWNSWNTDPVNLSVTVVAWTRNEQEPQHWVLQKKTQPCFPLHSIEPSTLTTLSPQIFYPVMQALELDWFLSHGFPFLVRTNPQSTPWNPPPPHDSGMGTQCKHDAVLKKNLETNCLGWTWGRGSVGRGTMWVIPHRCSCVCPSSPAKQCPAGPRWTRTASLQKRKEMFRFLAPNAQCLYCTGIVLVRKHLIKLYNFLLWMNCRIAFSGKEMESMNGLKVFWTAFNAFYLTTSGSLLTK